MVLGVGYRRSPCVGGVGMADVMEASGMTTLGSALATWLDHFVKQVVREER